MDEIKKNIDESWKEASEKTKEALKGEGKDLPGEPDFNFFITTLALQAAIFLGQIPNPVNNQEEKNMPQAKFIIDTLGMLKEKTLGNLTQEEAEVLENVLYELRMGYLANPAGVVLPAHYKEGTNPAGVVLPTPSKEGPKEGTKTQGGKEK